MRKSMLFCLAGCALLMSCLLAGCEKDPKAPDPGPGGFSGAVYDLFWVLKADGDLAFTCNQQWGTAMGEPDYPWLEHKAMIRRVTVDGLVQNVGPRSLAGCTNLTSVNLKEGVGWIDEEALKGCTALVSIAIPESVSDISNRAFEGCAALSSITLPTSVVSLPVDAFAGCTGLKSVTLLGDNVILYGNDPETAFPAEGDTLYVPVGTRATYEATVWGEVFTNIVEQ